MKKWYCITNWSFYFCFLVEQITPVLGDIDIVARWVAGRLSYLSLLSHLSLEGVNKLNIR